MPSPTAPRAYCDLHTHSTASDGDHAPEALAALVRDAGLEAFALTDHDTTAGLPAAAEAAEALGLAFVPGIELSADPAGDDVSPGNEYGTLHILGYFITHDDPTLTRLHQWLLQARRERNPRSVERLNALGVRIDYAEVEKLAAGGIVGRPHIAQMLVAKGYVKSRHEAFARYIGEGGAAHVPKQRLSPAEAIHAIHQAGGLAALAHPPQLQLDSRTQLAAAIARLAGLGLDAIETRHTDHTPQHVRDLEQLAARHQLLTTGGSDYHGPTRGARLGRPRVPMSAYETLREAHQRVAQQTRT